jgi:phage portal protein BeeE
MVAGTGLLSQPEADKPYWVTIQRTTQDMLFYGRAFWEVRDTDPQGYPTIVRRLPAVDVSDSKFKPGYVTYDNHDYPISAPYGPGTNVGSVIVFDGYGIGVLAEGAETIRLALALEASAAHYAATPLPQIALKNAGADLTPDQITALLTEWENARTTRTTAYLSSVMETETYGWNASELQLVDARNAQASMVARLLNLDPLWVGASVPGSSLSYANRVDLRKDLVDLTLSDFMSPIEQRLSMRDVTPTITNNIVRFNTNEFLRSNLESRVAMVTQLAPYPEILTTDEAREFLQDSPNGMGYPS